MLLLESLGDSVSYSIFGKVADMSAEGRKVYPLAIGEPSFATPKSILDRAYASMKSGETHYVSSFGIPAFREAVRDKVGKRNNIDAGVDNTIFLPTKLSVYASILATCGGRGEVLIPDPGYFYQQPVMLAGSRPVWYHLADDFSLDMSKVEEAASPETRALILNTPSNPTGKMLTKNELGDLLEFCKRRKIAIISDESYEDLTYSKGHVSVGSLEPEPDGVISLYSLSKSFAMTGWRAGYAVAAAGRIRLMNRFVEHTMSCFPPFIQEAAAYALRSGGAYTKRFRAELLERRNLLESRMRRIPRVRFHGTEGAFYSFPRLEVRMKSSDFCQKLLDSTGVAVLPGMIFGPAGEGHIRISFAAPRATIEEGIALLRRFLEGLPE